LGATITKEDSRVSILLVIRKDFVDDLQDFAPHVPQPTDRRFSHRLRNWNCDQALAVLRVAVRHDQTGFADNLVDELVEDLTSRGEVRPVELQVVASQMRDL